jgi:hypothetical protein
MSRYPALPDHVREALCGIVPSGDDELWYFPCRVTLRDGRILDTVYIEPEMPYLRWWGVYPEDDRGKRFVQVEDVVKVEDSPTRLPAQFANQIYDHGESGMGYTIFTVVFSDGERQVCITGNAVDFIRYPSGKGPNDVLSVLPHKAGTRNRLERRIGIGASIQGSLSVRPARRCRCLEASARSRKLLKLRIESFGITATGAYSNVGWMT